MGATEFIPWKLLATFTGTVQGSCYCRASIVHVEASYPKTLFAGRVRVRTHFQLVCLSGDIVGEACWC